VGCGLLDRGKEGPTTVQDLTVQSTFLFFFFTLGFLSLEFGKLLLVVGARDEDLETRHPSAFPAQGPGRTGGAHVHLVEVGPHLAQLLVDHVQKGPVDTGITVEEQPPEPSVGRDACHLHQVDHHVSLKLIDLLTAPGVIDDPARGGHGVLVCVTLYIVKVVGERRDPAPFSTPALDRVELGKSRLGFGATHCSSSRQIE